MSLRKTSKRKKKNKISRTKTAGRVGTILTRKAKRRARLEENKYITVNGKKIRKPQWRDK